jgi:RNA polymerase sigma factor (TIGR02999 family)
LKRIDPEAEERSAALEHRQELDRLFSVAYEELRRIASSVQHSGPKVGISTSTLINEAWLKLVKSSKLKPHSKLHFTCIAAKAMRQIVVDTARRLRASKRAALFITFDEGLGVAVTRHRDVLALDAALDGLSRLNPRQGRAVELRFFGGVEPAEIADVLGVSQATVDRDWRVAKAWLEAEIRKGL